MVNQDDVLLARGDHVGRGDDAGVAAVLGQNGEEAVAGAGDDLLGVLNGGVDGEAVDQLGIEHLGAHRNGHGDQARCGVGVVLGGDDGASALLGDLAHHGGDTGGVADDKQARAGAHRVVLRLVAVGGEDHVALGDDVFHHLGARAYDDVAGGDDAVRVAHDKLALKGIDDVGEAGCRATHDLAVKDVHVGVGDVLYCDEALQCALVVGDAQGGRTVVAHEVPRAIQARLAVDGRGLVEVGVLDLGARVGDEARLLEAKVLQHEGRLAVDGAGATGLVLGGGVYLRFQIGI